MARTTRAAVIAALGHENEPKLKEFVAAGNITPGMLVLLGSAGTIVAHSGAAAAVCPPHFAVESPYTDPEVSTAAIDTVYASGALVRTYMAQRGDEIIALLQDEGNVAVGAYLESDGAGALKARTTGAAVVRALQAVDNTGGSGPVRIRVEVL